MISYHISHKKNYDIIYYISISYMISCMISNTKNYDIAYDIIYDIIYKNYDIAYDIIYDGNFSLSCADDIIPRTMILHMIS